MDECGAVSEADATVIFYCLPRTPRQPGSRPVVGFWGKRREERPMKCSTKF